MKNILFFFLVLTSCKATYYSGSYGQLNQTQVVLSTSNFKHLGTFSGISSIKKMKLSIKDREGLISEARKNLLQNAKSAGVELTGSRTLVNVSVDMIQNPKRVVVTVTGDIIEFLK
ncbi:MAG TPA: hypothetical protein PK637_03605 [Flavobacteriales bacterium]|nr:hypothetical protein [Flavobacteriales bacterium]HRE75348.1 hypothetical protein [Flavobacteriales bacterium]HRE95824.1 hypothetical protein [Flavobacteriales bacterium]HRJ35173.1 hypothetical protein [Flavobacteriales bacterium]HRJ37591.1 hypothetical protein [Flavobacteriales bacterium]